MKRILFTLAVAGLLAGCGNKTQLTPVAGEPLPVAPLGRADRPSADELLAKPVMAAPERSVELRTRSEERADDPFDLPPVVERPTPTPAPSPSPTPR